LKHRGIVVTVIGALLLAGCGALIKPPRVVEQRNDRIQASKFKTLAVIGGDDARTTIRMSAQVREQLTKSGFNAVRRAGRWAGQMDALNEICQPGDEAVDGVLIVVYDRLTLHDCESKGVSYSIQGGGRIGLPEMADKLITYLKT
jgi:hypothetical protein